MVQGLEKGTNCLEDLVPDFDETLFGVDNLIAEIGMWISCESPSSDAAAVNRMQDLIADRLAKVPVNVERRKISTDCADVLIARYAPPGAERRAPILILSHVDTVHPTGSLGANPYRKKDDRLFGPGTADMKAGACMGLRALASVASQGGGCRPIIHIFTPDEELGSPWSRAVIEEMSSGAAFVLVTEAARPDGSVVTSRSGMGQFEVTLKGKAAHAGRFEDQSANAIVEAAKQIIVVSELTDRGRGNKLTVGQVRGGTAANVVPEYAGFSVDFRFTTEEAGVEVCQKIQGLRPLDSEVEVLVAGGINRPVFARSEAAAALFSQANKLAAKIGFDLKQAPMAGGTSDANLAAGSGAATLDGLGPIGAGGHTDNEHIVISSLQPRALLIRELLLTL